MFSRKPKVPLDAEEGLDDFYVPGRATNTRQLKCAVIGGGNRGQAFSKYAADFPHLLKVVAVADPREHVRGLFAKKYGVPPEMQFSDWKDVANREKLADFVLICTPDRLHKDPAIAFANKKYEILLEKPMATTKEDCIAIVKACEENKVILAVCHVLRYYPPNRKIKEIIDSGAIGDLVNIQHMEPIGFWHFAHSYVRGNWHSTNQSSFSLLAKSCHDVDLINYWMKNELDIKEKNICQCKAVSSFGSLKHFRRENKPEGGGVRCLDCQIEESCPYSAVKIYINHSKVVWRFPSTIVTDVEDIVALTEKLREGPYGKCVYECDNDVCDNQVVNFQFSGGRTASFTMVAFTESVCARKTRVFGTKGEVTYNGDMVVKHYDFLSRSSKIYNCDCPMIRKTSVQGHHGADFFLMDSFVKALDSFVILYIIQPATCM